MPRLLNVHVNSFARFVEPFDLSLDNRGLVLVEGENHDSGDAFDSNGAGKSMLFEAITWNASGKMARYGNERIGGDEVCYGDHGADVELVFENSRGRFRSRRRRQRSGSPSLLIEVDGQGEWQPLGSQGVTADAATDTLLSLLGVDFRTLRSAIFLQGTGLDVARSTFANQMKLLESVLRFDEYTRAAKIAQERARALEIEVRDRLSEMDAWSRQMESARNTIKELETLDETEQENLLIASIRALRAIPAAPNRRSAASLFAEITARGHECTIELRHAREHLAAVRSIEDKDEMTTRCHVCGAMLEKRERDALLAQALDAVNAWELALSQAQRESTEAEHALRVIDDQIERAKDSERERHQRERELRDIRERSARRLAVIHAQQEKLDEADREMARLTADVGTARANLSVAQTWSRHGFEELKEETLAAATPILNDAADRYAAIMSDNALRVEFMTLRSSRSEDLLRIRRGDERCAYESLSNGERRRVDLVIALALRDCARWRLNEPINIAVWDEVLDNLDESGLRRAVEVLQQDLSSLESVFLVSHNPVLKAMFPGARTLRVIRRHGVSHLDE